MIRPELAGALRRWAEPIAAVLATSVALWIVGGTSLRWGWLTLLLSAIVLSVGAVWTREAIRRVRRDLGSGGQGKLFVEERRLLYVGGLGNVQVDLDEVTRIDLAVARPNGASRASLLLHLPGAPPAMVPVEAEGGEALLSALGGLPGFDAEALMREIARRDPAEGVSTFWRRR